MRYILRNRDKIKEKLGQDLLDRMLTSIKEFEVLGGKPIDSRKENGDQYETILINDHEYVTKMISFYVISEKFDVVVLAFKEFIS